MRRIFLGLCALAAWFTPAAHAENAVQEFSGTGATTTPMFTVADRWEVRWNARQAISVAALSSNGTLVAGASGVLRGSLFVPAGGQYYLKITDGTSGTPAPATNAPAPSDEVPSEIVPENAPATTPAASWHVRVIQLARTVSSTETLTVYTPYFAVPDSAITAAPAPPAPPPPVLTPQQANALVTIKGDSAQGSGFLLRQDGKAFVVAHLRLLAANPNVTITTTSGTVLKILGMQAAADRNLVLINVQDDHLTCLEKARTDGALSDFVIIPMFGQKSAIAAKVGRIVNFAQDRIDFDAQVDITSNSAPVIAVNSGKVLGVVTAEKQIDLTEITARAWPENPVPGAEQLAPYFGLSLSGVPGWRPLDLDAFNRENTYLKNFHTVTRCLDGFLNGRLREPGTPPARPSAPPDSSTYTSNPRIAAAIDTYRKGAVDTDTDQAIEAARELLDDLQTIAASDTGQLRKMNFDYGINRRRAEEELAYRESLEAQLGALGNNIARFNNLAQSRLTY